MSSSILLSAWLSGKAGGQTAQLLHQTLYPEYESLVYQATLLPPISFLLVWGFGISPTSTSPNFATGWEYSLQQWSSCKVWACHEILCGIWLWAIQHDGWAKEPHCSSCPTLDTSFWCQTTKLESVITQRHSLILLRPDSDESMPGFPHWHLWCTQVVLNGLY